MVARGPIETLRWQRRCPLMGADRQSVAGGL